MTQNTRKQQHTVAGRPPRFGETGRDLVLLVVLLTITALIAYSPFISPGRSMIWRIDGVGQYYPVFRYIGEYLRECLSSLAAGHPSLPMFDLSIGMGEDVIGALNYYGFGDPVNLLAIFATAENGVAVFTFTFFLRVCLAAVSFYAFCRRMNLAGPAAVMGAVAYTFSGFVIYGAVSYYEWLSVLIYFPLLLMGVENVLHDSRGKWLLTLGAALGAVSGFYYLYMSSLGLAVYAIVRTLSTQKGQPLREHVAFCGRCLFRYIIGILIAAPILLPALYAFLHSQRSGLSIREILTTAANYKPYLNKVFWKSALNMGGTQKSLLAGISIFVSLACLLLVILPGRLLKMNRQRRQLLLGLILMLAALHIPMTGYVMNAFGETNDRWCFMVHFLMAFTAVYVYGTALKAPAGHVASASRGARTRVAGLLAIVLLAGTAVNCGLNARHFYNEKGLNWQEEFLEAEALDETYLTSPATAIEAISADEGVYRVWTSSITHINNRPENVAMLNDYNGVTYWLSIINGRTQSYVNLVNDKAYRWRCFGLNHHTASEVAAGVKYLLTNDPAEVPVGYEPMEMVEWQNSGWSVYRNQYADGMACVRSSTQDEALWAARELPAEEALIELAYNNNSEISGYSTDKTAIDGSGFRLYMEDILRDRTAKSYGTVTSFSMDKGHIRIEADVTAGDEIVISVPYNGLWRAKVNGVAAKVVPKDIAFMAVAVGSGPVTLEMVYVPMPFYLGLVACAAGIALWILTERLQGRRRDRAARNAKNREK
ncbi:MAG: YfhO family protein [Lachnospiraceae bacterium]|nr:YfhO family protein [Lachnospiraceae bacterium]